MAGIMNFNVSGVGSNIQFGKGGAKLVQTGGAFTFKNANESVLANVSVAAPSQADHAATKSYVDSVVQGLDPKASVVAATTENVTLSGVQTIDGVELAVGNRVLVKNQTVANENGIYVVGEDSWTRAIDANSSTSVTSGMFTFVEKGTTNASTGWVLSTNESITLGTTDLAFTQFSAAGLLGAGAGLVKTGNSFDVNVGNGIKIDNDKVAVNLNGSTLTVDGNGLKVSDATIQRITDVENSISELDQTAIFAGDGTKVETDLVAGQVTIDAAGNRVAAFKSGVGATTSVLFDNSTVDRISIGANTTLGTENVDLHFVPQGTGHVIFGNEGTGTIEADTGEDLILSGGSAATGEGGDLILRPGQGETATDSGVVKVTNAAGVEIATFKSDDTSTAAVNFSSGTTATTIEATGAQANVDIVLSPKGTGAVSVSSSIVADVLTPVEDTDAANKAYVDTAVSDAVANITTSLVGTLQTREVMVGTETVNIGSLMKGRVRRVMVQISTPYSAGAQLTIGSTTEGDSSGVVTADMIEETSTGMYEIDTSVNYSTSSQLAVFISGTPAAGAARITVEYIQG